MSLLPEYPAGEGDWICFSCQEPLVQTKVQVRYLGTAFDVVLPRCPVCGQVLVDKALAEGKMSEVEALLEDK